MATHTAQRVYTFILYTHVCGSKELKKTLVSKQVGAHQTHIPQRKFRRKKEKEKKKKRALLPREAERKSLVAVVELILKLTFSSPFPDSSAESIWIKRV